MSSARQKQVVITGIGLVTPLGQDRESSWQALKSGVSATRWLEDFPGLTSSRQGKSFGHLMAGAPIEIEADETEPVVELAIRAAQEAVSDSRLDLDRCDRNRMGCVVGTSKGGLRSFSQFLLQQNSQNNENISADLWQQFLPNAPAATISRLFDLRGAALCPVAACATGLTSILRGADLIRDGYCDVVLAGSTDASLQESVLASFHRMGVLANSFDDPETACKPFDRQRNGFLVGEGSAILILEDYEYAIARGATVYAEWVSGGVVSDNSGLTRLESEPIGLVRLIQNVLRQAKLTSSEIDYINLHGTATIQNDICETRALKLALGSKAYDIGCSSLKGAIGHLLGAAGSVELAATVLAMRDAVVPPTVNLCQQDEACDLNYTPRLAQPRRIENALKLSLGFGGHLVAGVIRAV